ncbi:sigma-70 family RNA polymerase sigma factor [Bacillus megaterium]|nr:sigma-70 family RNA polymerase sigma factor [Priestia megaterium]
MFTQEEDQQLLYLYFKENLTQKAIATIMNRSRDSIRNRLARLRNK